jgi:hypothetical protein
MENDQRCCAVCGESRTHGAKRGDEETYRKATRLVPTQRECVKFQIAATNVLKLIELARLSHGDFRSGFGTVFLVITDSVDGLTWG